MVYFDEPNICRDVSMKHLIKDLSLKDLYMKAVTEKVIAFFILKINYKNYGKKEYNRRRIK